MKFILGVIFCIVINFSICTKRTQYCKDVSMGEHMETRGFTLYPAPNDNHTVYVMWRRFPKTGFYNKPVTCVIVIDKTDDNGAGDVEINMASPNSSAVGLKFSSTPGKKWLMKYKYMWKEVNN